MGTVTHCTGVLRDAISANRVGPVDTHSKTRWGLSMSEVRGLLSVAKGEVAMGTVRYPTRDELETRREEILGSIGRSERELRHAAEFGVLSGDEYQALSELDVIEFLLGKDKVEVA